MTLLAALLATAVCPPATEASVRAAFDTWLAACRAPDLDWAALRRNYVAEFAATAQSEWRGEWDEVIASGEPATAFDGAAEACSENLRSLNYPAGPPR